jgi:hypothetical protein
MITEEETICLKCKMQFSDINPPRLLTICRHTFCEKCIKEVSYELVSYQQNSIMKMYKKSFNILHEDMKH